MNRLTEKDLQGNWCLKGVPWESLHAGQMITKGLRQKIYGALWKLMEYEDTGLSPEEVEEVNKFEGSNGQKWLLEIAKHRWIPVSERLPEEGEKVLVTVKHSSWISDFHSEWVSEKDKIHYPEINNTYIGYINKDGIWSFMDEEGQGNICDEDVGIDMGNVYDIAIAWQPLPAPYKERGYTNDPPHTCDTCRRYGKSDHNCYYCRRKERPDLWEIKEKAHE